MRVLSLDFHSRYDGENPFITQINRLKGDSRVLMLILRLYFDLIGMIITSAHFLRLLFPKQGRKEFVLK